MTAFIDGGLLYGQGQVWSNCMRSFSKGKLASMKDDPQYPALNHMELPYKNHRYYGDAKDNVEKDLWSKYRAARTMYRLLHFVWKCNYQL